MLGICDAESRFTYFSVGAFGSESDGGIFKNSSIGEALENGTANVPQSEPVYESTFPVPYYFLGDAAFPLRSYLMTPYGGHNLTDEQFLHNRELSRGRVVIENSFGVLAARWQVLLKTINCHPKNVDKIVLSVVLLHNFMLSTERNSYMPENFSDRYEGDLRVDGLWRQQTPGLPGISTNLSTGALNAAFDSTLIRDQIATLVFNENNNPED